MSDPTTTDDTIELSTELTELAPLLGGLSSFDGATELVREAIANGIATIAPVPVGDHGMIFRTATGGVALELDVRCFEDEPRLATFRSGTFPFVGVPSLAGYLDRYQTPDTIAYVIDVYGHGLQMLTQDTKIAKVVIDDHPANEQIIDAEVGRRAHTAELVLRPTAAARRWGAALAASSLSQEQFLDLIVDGVGEIASPDSADLRDLVQDLHAIRQTEVKSVVRTGGEGSITLAQNVKLHAGQGNEVTFPEQMTLVLDPFAGVAETIQLVVRIAPKVRETTVVFSLTASTLDDQLARLVGSIADDLQLRTGLAPLWTPRG